MAAFIAAGASILGGLISSGGATSAANTQAAAQTAAANVQQQMFDKTQSNEQPFLASGTAAQGSLNNLLGLGTPTSAGGYGSLLQPFNAQNFQSLSPAYQFQLQQGQQGVLNSDSTSQGALSGASQKDLIGYNQGMANTSFNNAFNQYQTQNANIYQRLAGVAGLGQQAGANYTTGASQFGQSIGANIAGAGASQAAGTVGVANAASGSLNNAAAWLYASQNPPADPGDFMGGP